MVDIIKHSQSTQSSKFAKLLQYLEKEVRMKFIFCAQISIKISEVGNIIFIIISYYHSLLRVFKLPKIGSWLYFCNIIRSAGLYFCNVIALKSIYWKFAKVFRYIGFEWLPSLLRSRNTLHVILFPVWVEL